jgi:tRNA 2-selenouridine synthase
MDKIHPSELQKYLEDRILIDVRSPAEYAHAHIPNAQNLPLFNNEERAKVGTAYKQVSPEHALIKGLEFVGPKMAGYVKKMIKWAANRKVVIHCWRGGKRSGSMAWLLRFAGFDVVTLEGGYKNYRNFILQRFENQALNIIILGGKTGSGKTAILHELEKQGEQIIDLEALAHHKGSAFGWIGENLQPSSEQFENNLYTVFSKIDPQKRVWIENESRTIGSVFIPQSFWEQMKKAPLIHVEVPFEKRIEHLIHNYTATSKEDLKLSFQKITAKIGHEALKIAVESVESGDFATAAAIGLKYYDKTYTYNFDFNISPTKRIIEISDLNFAKTAKSLTDFANTEGM